MTAKHHVLGYGWHDGRIHLKVAPGRAGARPVRLEVGTTLRLKRLAGQRCIGWRHPTEGGVHPCPDKRSGVGPQCIDCSRREGFWACMTCKGFECPRLEAEQERRCRQTHHLYLASFGLPEIKIGTASDGRRVARLVEQGPLAAAHVAAATGPVIKQMEALAVQSGFIERFRRSQKWRAFITAHTETEARSWISGSFQRLQKTLPASYEPYLHKPRWIELPERVSVVRDLPGVQLLALAPGEGVSGEVIGARGHAVLLDDGAGRLAVDLGALKSGFVEWDPVEAPRGPARQLGLF